MATGTVVLLTEAVTAPRYPQVRVRLSTGAGSSPERAKAALAWNGAEWALCVQRREEPDAGLGEMQA
jgi:hypothetical protein